MAFTVSIDPEQIERLRARSWEIVKASERLRRAERGSDPTALIEAQAAWRAAVDAASSEG